MAKSKKSQQKIDKSVEEQEKLKMLAKADEIKGEQLAFSKEGEFVNQKELKEFAIGNIENPEKKYDIYSFNSKGDPSSI